MQIYLCFSLAAERKNAKKGRVKMSLTNNEEIKKLDEKISQLKSRKKVLENKKKQKLKQEHTRLLIKFGELCQKYLDCKTPDELEEILKKLIR
jgi:hypothetical protein